MSDGIRTASPFDQRAVALLVIVCASCFAYFYQGNGWSSNAHFATIRSIVEHRTFRIGQFASRTGDVSIVDGRTYSNKPPGVAIIGAAPYALLATIEQTVGLELSDPRVETFNKYLLTMLLSAGPALALVIMMYRWFRGDGASVRTATLLAGAFALGSLLWPYAGM